MDPRIENLLEPSLAGEARPAALLSERAGFLVSFFGGPIAALLAGGFNVRALNRMRKDAWVLLAAVIASVAVVLLAANATLAGDGRGSDAAPYAEGAAPAARAKAEHAVLFGHELDRSTLRRLVQGSGLLVFLGFFLRHRRFHRALALADAKPARPWVIGLGCVALGWGMQLALAAAYVGMRG